MEFSTVPQEVLYQKRQMWITPGSRQAGVENHLNHSKDFTVNLAKFYGTTPASSSPKPGSMSKNVANFYGLTPPASGSDPNFAKNMGQFFGISPAQSKGPSRPLSNNTGYELNQHRFYSTTPSNSLQLKQNTKAFYSIRSPLISAGQNSISN
jgi:hypothetical protein